MLRNVLETQSPAKQNATDTINTLSSRLLSATLLEDRRAAILGLRSFAKQYPASVASRSLRALISSLNKDIDDVDTGKVVLETLLMLFNPNENSPEASEDITLWLADEFSQRQDNITTLLNLLEVSDFYPRLYALQLLSAISTARPERTQECILSAPLGATRLVSVLDDPRDAIRSAGLSLLIEVTQASTELQKLVAFENAFDRIFSLIKSEGSLAHGGLVVQDCLSLLANLLDLNPSNQSLFRETGFVPQLAQLLSDDVDRGATENDEAPVPNPSKDKNLWGLMAVLRMFLVNKSLGTQANQASFEKYGLLRLILNLGFSTSVGNPIRAEALNTCADIIRGNGKLQERFAHNQVDIRTALQVNGDADTHPNGIRKVYIIDALLDLTLTAAPPSIFDVRCASCECIQAYFYDHTDIRHHFLNRAVEGHTSGSDETSNILTILITGPKNLQSSDPYRLWFAALLAFHLVFEDAEAKTAAMGVREGEAVKGEEVITSIQAITGNLITALQGGDDNRICIGYLILLCGWLSEDADAVNDLLGEGSTVQRLIEATLKNEKGREMVQGLCAFLLGLIYEFSTKDSPVPRRTLQPLLSSGLGREQFIQKLTRLRQHPLLRDFEVLPQDLSSAPLGSLPEVYFDRTFVDFVKDNFNRVARAIDRDPGLEVARLHEGVDRDLLDSLRSQLSDKDNALQRAESDHLTIEQRLGQEQADHRRSQEKFNAELLRIKNINEALQKGHETGIARSEFEFNANLNDIKEQHRRHTQDLSNQIQLARSDAEKEALALSEQHKSEIAQLRKQIVDLESNNKQSSHTIEVLQRTNDKFSETVHQHDLQIASWNDEKKLLEEGIEMKTVNVRKVEDQVREQETWLKKAAEKEIELQIALKLKEESRLAVQTELDDLFILLGDLEEKRLRDKKKLVELGAETSDAEDADGAENDVEEDKLDGDNNNENGGDDNAGKEG